MIKSEFLFGNVKGRHVYILQRVKTKTGYIVIQDLKTGITYHIPKREVKNISATYPQY